MTIGPGTTPALDALLAEVSCHIDAVVSCRFEIRSSGALSLITLL